MLSSFSFSSFVSLVSLTGAAAVGARSVLFKLQQLLQARAVRLRRHGTANPTAKKKKEEEEGEKKVEEKKAASQRMHTGYKKASGSMLWLKQKAKGATHQQHEVQPLFSLSLFSSLCCSLSLSLYLPSSR